MSGLEEQMRTLVRGEIERAAAMGLFQASEPPPEGVNVATAGRMLGGICDAEVRRLVGQGRLRTMDLGGSRRIVISVQSIRELDPGYDPAAHRPVLHAVPSDQWDEGGAAS